MPCLDCFIGPASICSVCIYEDRTSLPGIGFSYALRGSIQPVYCRHSSILLPKFGRLFRGKDPIVIQNTETPDLSGSPYIFSLFFFLKENYFYEIIVNAGEF